MAAKKTNKNPQSKAERWKWNDEKSEYFLDALKAFKRQKLGEGLEWDSDKVVLFENIRVTLAAEWPDDFGKPETTQPDKPMEDMTKDEYKKYAEIVKEDKEMIRIGYKRIANKFKALKQSYGKDCKDGLRSGAGQLTAKFWHDCHELWGGSAGTEALDFGIETQSASNANDMNNLDVEENGDLTTTLLEADSDSDEDESGANRAKRKKSYQTPKHFVDNKREKLQKGLTQKAKQDILLQHSREQLDLQQEMVKAMNQKDASLDTAIKSMADSTAVLCNTLATTMHALTDRMNNHGNALPFAQPQFHMSQYGYHFDTPQ